MPNPAEELKATEAILRDAPDDLGATFDPMKTRVLSKGTASRPASFAAQSRLLESIPLSHWALRPAEEALKGTGKADSASYALGRQLGRGGFGEVWEATQVSLDRVVALKRIRRDLEQSHDAETIKTLEILFRQEALTAARLEHPNIVPVYDLGLDEAGKPVLAMKVVRGRPWDALIDEEFSALPAAEFLAKHLPILMATTNAVAFAHSLGVIHRDLKPAQVMVGKFGEVLLMDWGLAILADTRAPLAMGSSLRSDIALTPQNATSPAGTIPFMAPEQTEDTAENVGTWTDVYLLGGTLYYLLTGKAPHVGETREQVYYKARNGNVAPVKLAAPDREIPQELADLAMRAMAPRPDERVASAELFLKGLQDYLAGTTRRRESAEIAEKTATRLEEVRGDYRAFGECVTALGHAETLWPENPRVGPLREEALSRFAETALGNGDLTLARVQADGIATPTVRSRILDSVGRAEALALSRARQRRFFIGIAATLFLVVAVGGWFYTRELETALAATDAARRVAVNASNNSEKLTKSMLTEMRDQLRRIGRVALLDTVARQALDYYNGADPSLTTPVTLKQHSDALDTIGEVFRDEGASDKMREAFAKSLELRRTLAERDKARVGNEMLVAQSHNQLSRSLREQGDIQGALAEAEKALAIAAKLAAMNPNNDEWVAEEAASRGNMGGVLAMTGKVPEGLEQLRTAMTLRKKIAERNAASDDRASDLAGAHMDLGGMLRRTGPAGLDEAIVETRAALAIRRGLAAKAPMDTLRQDELARALFALSLGLAAKRDMDGAKESLAESLAIRERLAELDPLNRFWQRDLGVAYNTQGRLLADSGDGDQAEAMIRKAVAIRQHLVDLDPKNATWLRDLSASNNALAATLLGRGDLDGAERAQRLDAEISRRLAELDPANADRQHELALSRQALGDLLRKRGKADDAIAAYREAIVPFEAYAAKDKANPVGANDVSWNHYLLGEALQEKGDAASAKAEWALAVDVLAPYMADPAKVDNGILDSYVRALAKAGRKAEAREMARVLRGKGWDDAGFLEFCKAEGL